MNDVRQKKIKCIVVKDLSRFGRNYLEAGYYIETVFPFLGVRLIAVTDNFDSTRKEDMESLALPIRNMVNAMYAKDISKKIWTSLQRKKEAGYAVGNDAPYGYIRNPVTKRNEIDPEAAFYVQLIFQWELMGVPIFEIARRMTLLQVPTPREWHRKMVEGKEVLTYKKWGVTTIRHILENQTYVGDTINNKSTQKLFAGQDRRDLPKEQWYVAKNTHPAIIARDDFEKVQKILNKNRAVFNTVRAKSEQIRAEYQNDLAGMVFCADCGRAMEFERLPHGAEESKKVCYYICKARQADDKCIGHQIPEKLLKALIMDQLHLFIKFNGFFTKLSNGEYLLLNEQGYQVEGQKGTWTVTDEKTIDEQRFVLMVNDQKPDLLPSIVVQSDGKFITSTASGFDNATVRKVRELLHHEKLLENGTAERARESGTEQNYNMIDGCVNNVPKKPRVIGGRVSVLDRLHIKQAERARKDNAQVQQQERTRKN